MVGKLKGRWSIAMMLFTCCWQQFQQGTSEMASGDDQEETKTTAEPCPSSVTPTPGIPGPYDKWSALILTFLKFTPMPIKTEQTSLAGWVKDADHNDKARYFAGDRYVFNSTMDETTRLIFDCDGRIAGLQATIPTSDTYPTVHNSPPWKLTDNGAKATITAYFRDPKKICPKTRKRLCKERLVQKLPIGEGLWIQYDDVRDKKAKMMKIPLTRDQLKGTPWVEGSCAPYMGVHYHYNISTEMDCDYAIPVFLIINKQTGELHGFGWGVPLNITSDRWEHPQPSVFTRSVKPENLPQCLTNLKAISVQHVYFVNPATINCT